VGTHRWEGAVRCLTPYFLKTVNRSSAGALSYSPDSTPDLRPENFGSLTPRRACSHRPRSNRRLAWCQSLEARTSHLLSEYSGRAFMVFVGRGLLSDHEMYINRMRFILEFDNSKNPTRLHHVFLIQQHATAYAGSKAAPRRPPRLRPPPPPRSPPPPQAAWPSARRATGGAGSP
jgi:hypothetical protein